MVFAVPAHLGFFIHLSIAKGGDDGAFNLVTRDTRVTS